MNKRKIVYFITTLLFVLCCIVIISRTDLANNVELSKAIEIILILYLIRLSYGCILYIKKKFTKQYYSYKSIMILALSIFININILRQIDLLIENWNLINIVDIYNNTIESFSFFAMLTLPCIIILSIYSIITNIILIQKEGFAPRNLLGILLGIISLVGLYDSQMIYILTSKLLAGTEQIIIKKLIDVCINATLSYLYALIIATLYCNIKSARHNPAYDKDFVIILGSKINKDGSLTPLLKGRADRAIEFGNNQYEQTKKKIVYIPSGGQGSDEVIAEAKAIKHYLIENGINENSIVIEDKSSSTIENMRFSKEIIYKINKDAKISFSTSDYHVFRSGIIANNQGIECEGMGCKTKWYFYTNALIREFVANLSQEKKYHILVLLVINIILILLVMIGYYYNLFNI